MRTYRAVVVNVLVCVWAVLVLVVLSTTVVQLMLLVETSIR